MTGTGVVSVMAVALLLAAASDVAEAGQSRQGRDLAMKKSLCMWVEESGACVADIFGNVEDEQVLAETKALAVCPIQESQEVCEKAGDCFWDQGQDRCIADVTSLNSECYFDEWNTIQRTFQCPQFGGEDKCTDGLPGCVWNENACAIDDAAVQTAVQNNETIANELDQFQECREAGDKCEAPCADDPTAGCLYVDLFNPTRFVKEKLSNYCQLQIARAACTTAPDCTALPDCFTTENGACVITPEAIVKFALADDPKISKKVTKALTDCQDFTTEKDCLAHK